MRARRFRRSALLVAGLALLMPLTPFSPTDADAALPGSFEGEMLCDRGFEDEGETGPSRPTLSGPCWFDLIPGGQITGPPRFVADGDNRLLEACGTSSCGELIAQPITVPYGITEATLSADIYDIDTDTSPDECSESIENSDYGVVYVFDAAGSDPYFVLHCETGPSGLQHYETDITDALSTIEGQSTYVYVGAATSEGDPGETFYFDNVSLLVSAEGQPMTTYSRKATLSLKNHVRASGTISSPDAEAWLECTDGVTVRFQRKKGTEWVTLTKQATTDGAGSFTVLLPDRPGTYRAVVAQSKLDVAHRCGKVVSPLRTHQH